MGAEAHGDHAEEPALEVVDALVEQHQHVGDPRHRRLGEHLVHVAVRVLAPQRVPGRRLVAPVEHLLPVGHLGGRGGLDEEARVARSGRASPAR